MSDETITISVEEYNKLKEFVIGRAFQHSDDTPDEELASWLEQDNKLAQDICDEYGWSYDSASQPTDDPAALKDGDVRNLWEVDLSDPHHGPFRVQAIFHVRRGNNFFWETDLMWYEATDMGDIVDIGLYEREFDALQHLIGYLSQHIHDDTKTHQRLIARRDALPVEETSKP